MNFVDGNSASTSHFTQQSYGTIDPDLKTNNNRLLSPQNAGSSSTLSLNSNYLTIDKTPYYSPSQSSLATLANTNYSEVDCSPLDSSNSMPALDDDESSPLLTKSTNTKTIAGDYGVALVLLALFVAESARGMVIPTMTPYIFHMGGSLTDVGISVSLYSVGKLISAAPLGYLTEYTGSTRIALLICAFFSILANILYGTAFVWNHVWVVIGSRFLLGLSTSIMGIGRAYLAAVATSKPKAESPLAKYIAWSGFVQYVGFSLTPIFSAIFGMFGKKSHGDDFVPPVYTVADYSLRALGVGSNDAIKNTLYTVAREFGAPESMTSILIPENPGNVPILDCVLPAFFLALLNVVLIVLLLVYMAPLDPRPQAKPTPQIQVSSAVSAPQTQKNEKLKGKAEFYIPASNNFASDSETEPKSRTRSPSVSSNISEAESIVPPVIEDEIVTIDQTALNIAFFVFFYMNFAIRGIIGVVEAIAPAQYQEILGPDHENIAGSAAVYFTVLGLFGLVTFLTLDPFLKATRIHANHMLAIGIAFIAVGTTFMIRQVHQMEMWVFTIGIFCIWAIGSPICQTLTILSLSELLGSKPQAVVMSYLTNAGSLGRIIFPTLATLLPSPGIEICDILLCIFSLVFALYYHSWLDNRMKNTAINARKMKFTA
ncbi:hypothetical protein HK098_007026 [Nowakowskiella sp. JEL0407]|nr:hypothetical protein HK098_007026 [Nowakowskiella sp. JEL0407]